MCSWWSCFRVRCLWLPAKRVFLTHSEILECLCPLEGSLHGLPTTKNIIGIGDSAAGAGVWSRTYAFNK